MIASTTRYIAPLLKNPRMSSNLCLPDGFFDQWRVVAVRPSGASLPRDGNGGDLARFHHLK